MERFLVQRALQREVSKVVQQRRRQLQELVRQRAQQAQADAAYASCFSGNKRSVRLNVVKALMDMRLHDDKVERFQLKRTATITAQLQQQMDVHCQNFSSLVDQCLYELAKTLDMYDGQCPHTQEWFSMLEPWMVTKVAELATSMRTLNDSTAALILQQRTEQLTIGFTRLEASLALLVAPRTGHNDANSLGDPSELKHQAPASLFRLASQVVENWEDLDVDDIDVVATQDEDARLLSLRLISCGGLNKIHGTAELNASSLELVDCFDADSGREVMEILAQWRHLKTLRFSWCSWLSTELLVTFANKLLEPPVTILEEIAVSQCFDVVEDYVRSIFLELHPTTRFAI
ncbi:TPA: hypothetical protein N0F65_012287 [Lagenidium giganteum]|uniref:Uncharacterized protein n=1 Tax=Lagenidium giganteum TaxID=4803 RepID=A0AAV2ZG20_9STRA|nr:TPA: hypothetical protein N0F65_012287 [Lagenidium giganteum]